MASMTMRALLADLLSMGAGPALAQSAAQTNSWNPALERKCTAKDALACWQLADVYTTGRGVAKNAAKAEAAFARACDLGVAEACVISASHRLESGDPPGATAQYRKGCEAGLGEACLATAVRTEKGKGAAADPGLAMAYYERACTLRSGTACDYLAQHWHDGEAPANRVDGPRAYAFADKGCAAGNSDSCTLASWLAWGNEGVPENHVSGEHYAQMGCNFGEAQACMNLANMVSQRGDWTTARTLQDKACRLSRRDDACKAVRDIDAYLADLEAGRAERERWDRTQSAGAAAVGRLLAAGDYNGAMSKAAYDLGSTEQVSRVILAANGAGAMGQIDSIYFEAFETWQLTPQARALSSAEKRRRDISARQAARLTDFSYTRSSSPSSTWAPAPASSPTFAPIPTISESEIYKNARERTRSSYCAAGWGGCN